MVCFVLERVENIVGKGENAGNLGSLLFQQCLKILLFRGLHFVVMGQIVKFESCI